MAGLSRDVIGEQRRRQRARESRERSRTRQRSPMLPRLRPNNSAQPQGSTASGVNNMADLRAARQARANQLNPNTPSAVPPGPLPTYGGASSLTPNPANAGVTSFTQNQPGDPPVPAGGGGGAATVEQAYGANPPQVSQSVRAESERLRTEDGGQFGGEEGYQVRTESFDRFDADPPSLRKTIEAMNQRRNQR